MENGEPLHPTSKADATLMGVADPDAVRIVIVDKIPQPEAYPVLMEAARTLKFLDESTAGLTLGSAILINRDYAGHRRLIAHELVHVGQYERLGSIQGFLTAYLAEVASSGYLNAPMEQEAVTREKLVPHELLS